MSHPAFSLVDGGPLCRLIRRLGWVRPDGRCNYFRACLVLVAVTWGPLFVLSMAERVVTGRAPLIDWSVHARLLVAVPLLFRAEASLHWRSQKAIGIFLEERWAPDQADRVAKIIAFAEKLRDAVAPEVILLGLALVGSQAVVWPVGGRPSFVTGLHARSSAVRAQVLVRAGQSSCVPVLAVPLPLAVGHLGTVAVAAVAASPATDRHPPRPGRWTRLPVAPFRGIRVHRCRTVRDAGRRVREPDHH